VVVRTSRFQQLGKLTETPLDGWASTQLRSQEAFSIDRWFPGLEKRGLRGHGVWERAVGAEFVGDDQWVLALR
jgi:hypothetical protein